VTNLLQQGETWLAGMFQKHASRPVSYHRGLEWATLQATIGRTVFQVADQFTSAILSVESRDYLIVAERFQASGFELPQAGDRIHEVQGDKEYVYEVMAPGQEPCWRWADLSRGQLRIHAKLVEEQ
jgi:hypothetical protein